MTAFYLITAPIMFLVAATHFKEGNLLEGIAGLLLAASFLVSFYARVSQ